MIRATPPRGKPLHSWVCVWCPAHGPADNEAHMRQLTKEHLAACHGSSTTDERIAALSAEDGHPDGGVNCDTCWLIAELRRAREHLQRIADGEFCHIMCDHLGRKDTCEHRDCAKEGLG